MRKLILLAYLWTMAAAAQVVGPGFVNYVTSAPSGACSQGAPMQVVMGLGTVYTCQSGTWATVGGGGAGTVTSVLGTTNQINSDGSTTTPTLSLSSTIIAPGTVTVSIAGAASTPGLTVSGAPFTGGSGTTTFPQVYINSGAATTTFSTSGTALGINAPSGFAGNFFDLHLNGGASLFSVSSVGAVTAASSIQAGTNVSAAAGGQLSFVGRGKFLSPADGVLTASNNASNGFTRLNFGVATSSGPALCISGTTITACLGDGTAGGTYGGALDLGASALKFGSAIGTSTVGLTLCTTTVLCVGNTGGADSTRSIAASSIQSRGTKFTLSSNGCSATTTLGGGSAGSFVSGTTGTCAVTILMGDSATAPTGWHCTFENHTTSANFLSQTGAADTTHCSMTGTTVSGDLISFSARGY